MKDYIISLYGCYSYILLLAMWTSAFEIRITYGNLTKNYNLNIVVYALYDYSLFHVLPGSSNFFCQVAVANYLLYSRSTYWIIVWRNKQVSYKIFFGWKLFLFSVFILHQAQILMLIYKKQYSSFDEKLKWYWSNCTICKNLWILRKWRFESLFTGYTKHLWCYIFDFSFNPFPQFPSYKYLWVQYISNERLRVRVICKKVIWTQL